MEILDKLITIFKKEFGENENIKKYFAPGRVNLIGEHIDYNGGKVFPCALDFGTYGIVGKRKDKKCRMYSLNFENIGIREFSLENIKNVPEDDWVNYPKGVIKIFQDKGYEIKQGLDIVFFGNIPNGAGLSSSASIEVLMGTILKEEFNLDISMVEIVKMSQKAENEFIGVNCGIMDQFAIGMGKEDHAILLDCNSLEYNYAPFKLNNISIVIANTNKRRGLGESKYNERRTSCEEALKNLQENGVKINSLCEMTMEKYLEVEKYIKSLEGRQRVKHAVSENERVLKAMESLKENNIEDFGKLMNSSHKSLKEDYEVTGLELDTLVEAAWEEKGTIGARMTGAGFGGCTVNLVEDACVDRFIKNVGEKYKNKTGLEATFYIGKPGAGARKLEDR